MNPPQQLEKAFYCLNLDGSARTSLTRPKRDSGIWHLDLRWNQVWVVYQWSPALGHGVSLLTDDVGYGEGPEHVYQTLEEAAEKVATLLELDDLDSYALIRGTKDPEFSEKL